MAFAESLAGRTRGIRARRKGVAAKRMVGGVGFLLHGHRCPGVWEGSLIARPGTAQGEAAIREPHVRPFDLTGRAITGWVPVGPHGVADDDQFSEGARLAVEFVGGPPRE